MVLYSVEYPFNDRVRKKTKYNTESMTLKSEKIGFNKRGIEDRNTQLVHTLNKSNN